MGDRPFAKSKNKKVGVETVEIEDALTDRKASWGKLQRFDSFQLEAGRVSKTQSHSAKVRVFFNFEKRSCAVNDI